MRMMATGAWRRMRWRGKQLMEGASASALIVWFSIVYFSYFAGSLKKILMRILHTADWHLGKKLDQNERTEEHRRFLSWLLACIESEQIDALIIAGDVFDTGAPSNESLGIYYNFLVDLRQTACRKAVVIGGNHDSISTLNAPRELLRALDVHVVGGVPDAPEEQIIALKDAAGKVCAVVAAVPFLRDRDVRLSVPGESSSDREQRLKEGISRHYFNLLPLLEPYQQQGIPLLATGHLFVQGATACDSEKEIHVGTLGQLPASAFPAAFQYIALGHLHRPQTAAGMPHIRYSGSPIPLSFSESGDRKEVVVIETGENAVLSIKSIPVPCFRPLLRIQGSPDEVKQKVAGLNVPSAPDQLSAWLEVQVHTQHLQVQLQDELLEILRTKPFADQLFLRQIRLHEAKGVHQTNVQHLQLTDMSPMHVFTLKLESTGMAAEAQMLQETFTEALQLMEEEP